ncbi:MAG: hypothetical protein KGL44_13335 [Sphingomonadales bacterium]|nr:hypothetical protein [Sphingomonadales bacterium]
MGRIMPGVGGMGARVGRLLAVFVALLTMTSAVSAADSIAESGQSRGAIKAPSGPLSGTSPAGWAALTRLAASGQSSPPAAFATSSLGAMRIGQDGSIQFWPAIGNGTAQNPGPQRSAARTGRLPVAIASPAVAAVADGFVVVGGTIDGVPSNRAFLIVVTSTQGGIGAPVELPRLPKAIAMSGAVTMGERLFVTGLDGSVFALELRASTVAADGWTSLPQVPAQHGCARLWPVVQYDGEVERLHAVCLQSGGAAASLKVWRWIEGRGAAVNHWVEKAGVGLGSGDRPPLSGPC